MNSFWLEDTTAHYDVPDLWYVADIVEGMVNKGIFLNGDNGGTFLHFGNYQNSCISDPTLCGPEGEQIVLVSFGRLQSGAMSVSCFNSSVILQGLLFLFFGKTMSWNPVLLWRLEGKLSPMDSLCTPTPWEDMWSFTLEATTTDGRPIFPFQVWIHDGSHVFWSYLF